MNTISQMLIVLSTVFTLISCNDVNNANADSTLSTTADEHQHSYRCPMNCEKGKTYEKAGKCPVCGMDLEHFDGEDNGLTYKMEYTSTPAELNTGTAATLSFKPKVAGKESEAVALDLQHEKKIHLIVVSDDLSYFEHIHPEYQTDGSYQIKVLGKNDAYSNGTGKHETKFEQGGDYFLFADYKPSGGAHQVEKVPFKVNGPSKTPETFTNEKLAGTSGNYSVTLNVTGGKFVSGSPLHITGTISKDGQPIDANSLENYLGAKAHMVVLSIDDKEYLHVHPDVANGKLDLNTTFKKPGIYRGWIQFNGDGQIHTTDFTLKVNEGSATAKQ